MACSPGCHSEITESEADSKFHPKSSGQQLNMQCPYIWTDCVIESDEVYQIVITKSKLLPYECNDWRKYCLLLFLGCLHGHRKDEVRAVEEFDSCERFIDSQKDETFFRDMVPGMKHVLHASKQFYLSEGKQETSNKLAASVPNFQELSKESKASVLMAKAYIINHCGLDGMLRALECAKLAIQLDPDEDGKRRGAWYCFAGKVTAQSRRLSKKLQPPPDKQEIEFLLRGIKYNPFPKHYVVLADSLRESGSYWNRQKNCSASRDCYTSALMYYKKALNGNEGAVGILRRCGTGLLKLPKWICSGELAEQCLKKAEKLAPDDGVVQYQLGNVECWRKSNNKEGLKYYEKAFQLKNYIAAKRIIQVKYEMDNSYNPLHDIHLFLSQVPQDMQRKTDSQIVGGLLSTKGEYLMIVRKELIAAAKEIQKAITISPDVLRYGMSVFSRGRHTFSEIFEEEISKSMRRPNFSPEDFKCLIELLNQCKASNPRRGTQC